VRDLQSKTVRAGVDMEYVKNVVVKYIELHNQNGQTQALGIIESVLEFTPEDVRKVRQALELYKAPPKR